MESRAVFFREKSGAQVQPVDDPPDGFQNLNPPTVEDFFAFCGKEISKCSIGTLVGCFKFFR